MKTICILLPADSTVIILACINAVPNNSIFLQLSSFQDTQLLEQYLRKTIRTFHIQDG